MSTRIIDCPSCSRKLRVPDELLGRQVKCPTCEHKFQAAAPAPAAPAPGTSRTEVLSQSVLPNEVPSEPADPQSLPQPVEEEQLRNCPHCGQPVPPKVERCPACGGGVDEEEDEERPWDEPQLPSGRRDAEPHRGTMILVFGILSICGVSCLGLTLPLGIIALVMGRNDLKKMRENVMDSEGQGLTQAGWICAIIGTIFSGLTCLGMTAYISFVFLFIGQMRKQVPPRPAPVPVKPAPERAPQLKDRPPPAPNLQEAPVPQRRRAPEPGPGEGIEFSFGRMQDYLPPIQDKAACSNSVRRGPARPRR